MRRTLTALFIAFATSVAAQGFDPVVAGRAIELPRDAGAHPGHRIEWWYVTGHLESPEGPLGFQVTFFRLRYREAEQNPSRFSPREILLKRAAAARGRPRNYRGQAARSERSRLARSRMVERDDDLERRRLGLGRREPRRWRLPHGVSHARCDRTIGVGGRDDPHRR